MSKFSKELSNLLKRYDMSDEYLALKVNVNRTTVNRWKTGERSPKMEKLPEIAAVFSVDPRVFIEGANLDDDIFSIYSQLSDEKKRKVYQYVKKQLKESSLN